MDIGFLEAKKLFLFDCVIFHDVDLLMEDDRSIYACYKQPRHMTSHIDKHNYILTYKGACGGVTAILKETFEKLNGFGTIYWGWGGEDDDLYRRITKHGLKVQRQHAAIERFTQIKHRREQHNPNNIYKDKMSTSKAFPSFMRSNGLNSIKYKVYSIEHRPLFTWMYAEPLSVLSKFHVHDGGCEKISNSNSTVATLTECADRCDNDEKCHRFLFYFIKNGQPRCRTKLDRCDFKDAKNSYVYTKGRIV